MDRLNYQWQNYNQGKRCAGLIVLQTDEVVEAEVRAWLPQSINLYHTRIPNQDIVTEETLAEMGRQIPAVCRLFPKHAPIDVIAYCCTSGATVIGESVVEKGVREVFPDAKVTNPLTAAKAQLQSLNTKRIGLLTPYIPSVTQAMSDHLHQHGFDIVSAASFYEENDFDVCHIGSESIKSAVEHVAAKADCDAIFASCTNLRTHGILDLMSRKSGIPIISSNAALAWHISELSDSLS